MAYMRGTYYVFGSDNGLEFYTPYMTGVISQDKADDLAVMLFMRMVKEGRAQAVIERVYENYAGNFGADAVSEYLGKPTTMDLIREMVTQHQEETNG